MAKVSGGRRLSKVEEVAQEFGDNLVQSFRRKFAITRGSVQRSITASQICHGVYTVFLTYDVGPRTLNLWVDVFDGSVVFKRGCEVAPRVFKAKLAIFGKDLDKVMSWHGRIFDVPALLQLKPKEDSDESWSILTKPVRGYVGMFVDAERKRVVIDSAESLSEFVVRQGEWLEHCAFLSIEGYIAVQEWAKARSAELNGTMDRREAESALHRHRLFPEYGNGRLLK